MNSLVDKPHTIPCFLLHSAFTPAAVPILFGILLWDFHTSLSTPTK